MWRHFGFLKYPASLGKSCSERFQLRKIRFGRWGAPSRPPRPPTRTGIFYSILPREFYPRTLNSLFLHEKTPDFLFFFFAWFLVLVLVPGCRVNHFFVRLRWFLYRKRWFLNWVLECGARTSHTKMVFVFGLLLVSRFVHQLFL